MRNSPVLWFMVFCLFGFTEIISGQQEPKTSSENTPVENAKIKLIIRIDDIGFCHATNLALKRILDEGVVTAVSVIVTTPWLDEAAEILREHPEVSVGVHLALNSEWREFRWGPVMPYNKVPTLVDAFGKFYGSRRELMAHKPRIHEVAQELKAQIELALRKGLKISYCDYHMGAAMSTLEFQEIVERLALEYGIGISRYFGEQDTPNVYSVPPEQKLEEGIKIIDGLSTPGLYLFVCHP
ncbi:ChbG/HpnK family deacetylase, partial [Candidatus Sumerlaeota bacterium]|nr:ChbG/HpnK family deacetylase [Candidatus Sumerlaeota bacterium]